MTKITLRQFVKKYYDKETPKRVIYNGKDYTKKTCEITKKKLGTPWKIGSSPYTKGRFIVFKIQKKEPKEPFETYYKKYKKELEIVYKQTLKN